MGPAPEPAGPHEHPWSLGGKPLGNGEASRPESPILDLGWPDPAFPGVSTHPVKSELHSRSPRSHCVTEPSSKGSPKD